LTGVPADRLPTSKAFKRLTLVEAQQALYIDFEGVKDKLPVLLGTLNRGGRGPEPFVFQVVVDSEFRATGTEERPFKEAIRTVVQRAEAGNRRIVAWSEHELEVVRRLLPDERDLVDRFTARYANALGIAKRWAAKAPSRCKADRGRTQRLPRDDRVRGSARRRSGSRRRHDPCASPDARRWPTADAPPEGAVDPAAAAQPTRLRRHEGDLPSGNTRARRMGPGRPSVKHFDR